MEELGETEQYSTDCDKDRVDISENIDNVWVGDEELEDENKNNNTKNEDIETLAKEEEGGGKEGGGIKNRVNWILRGHRGFL